MRKVTYSMSASADGYIYGPDGDFQWSVPNEQIFNLATDEVRRASVHLLGRRLYESMLFWENDADDDALGFSTQEFARLWRGLPKLVFSHSLTSVAGNARLATGTLAQEIERLRSEPGAGDIAIGGATLAAQAVELGLIDEENEGRRLDRSLGHIIDFQQSPAFSRRRIGKLSIFDEFI